MNRMLVALAVLLALQLVVAAGLGYAERGITGPAKETPLVALTDHSVDRITIEGPDKAKVVLAKAKGAWQLPDAGGFPADATRVKDFVAGLAKLEEGLPVATTRDAQGRFKVSDKDFERRVTLQDGGRSVGTVYFGTAASMREIHARRAGQSDVYAVQFASWQMPVKTSDWEDKTLLQIPVKDISAIDVAGLHLVHANDQASSERSATGTAAAGTSATGTSATGTSATGASATGTSATGTSATGKSASDNGFAWLAAGLGSGETLDETAAATLAGSLADLEFDHVLTSAPPAADGLASPALELTVTKRGGGAVALRIGKSKDGKTYTLKSSARSEYFDLPSYAAEPLIVAAARDKLLGIKPAAVTAKH